jgi:bifunctional DNA-binding transcriptional regulator/antitoxin component of YhaV-PrlF toxin-antitoxin module
MPAISKITAKGQTTIPQEIRTALKSKPGDLDHVGGTRTVAARKLGYELEALPDV